jgi:hypothetical protein
MIGDIYERPMIGDIYERRNSLLCMLSKNLNRLESDGGIGRNRTGMLTVYIEMAHPPAKFFFFLTFTVSAPRRKLREVRSPRKQRRHVKLGDYLNPGDWKPVARICLSGRERRGFHRVGSPDERGRSPSSGRKCHKRCMLRCETTFSSTPPLLIVGVSLRLCFFNKGKLS